MTAASREDGVKGGDRVGRARHGAGVDWFHQSWGGHEEGGVDGSTGGGDDLAAATEDGFGGQGYFGELEFGVSYCCNNTID